MGGTIRRKSTHMREYGLPFSLVERERFGQIRSLDFSYLHGDGMGVWCVAFALNYRDQ